MRIRVLISCLFVSACLLAAIPATAQIPLTPVWPNDWVNTVDDDLGGVPSMFPESYVASVDEIGMITDLYVVGDSYTVFVKGMGRNRTIEWGRGSCATTVRELSPPLKTKDGSADRPHLFNSQL